MNRKEVNPDYFSQLGFHGRYPIKEIDKGGKHEKTISNTVNLLFGAGVPDDFTCFCKK
jgi:hypothetical protein